MLLSIASALHTDPRGSFNLHNTERVLAGQPLSQSDWPEPGIMVMRTSLRSGMFDAFRNVQVPAGTEVWAPVRRVTTGSAFFGTDFVYAAHDDPVLRESMQAFFYEPTVIEGLAKAEFREEEEQGYGGVMLFDPLTFGTGEVAQQFHPRGATLSDADRQELQQQFLRARGSRAKVNEALLTSHHLDSVRSRGLLPPLDGISGATSTVYPVFLEPRELACMFARVRNALDAPPRGPAAQLPANNGQIPAALLPRGAEVNECCEGQVVQAPAVWSLRTDARVVAAIENSMGALIAGLPFDLPLVCTTGDQIRVRALDTSRPWLSRAGTTGGVAPRRMGVLSLGPSPLPLWTVMPADIAFVAEMVDASGNLSALPDRVQWEEPYRAVEPVSSIAEFIAYITSNGASQGVLRVRFDARGISFRLAYAACPPGHLALWDSERSPYAVHLPPTQLPAASQLVLGLRVGAQPGAKDPALRERLLQGLCVEHDATGIQTGVVVSGADAGRVRGLLPAGAVPYAAELTHATFQRDARVQNLLFAVPHVFNDYSVRLRAAV